MEGKKEVTLSPALFAQLAVSDRENCANLADRSERKEVRKAIKKKSFFCLDFFQAFQGPFADYIRERKMLGGGAL